jgi:hypothetical protein
VNRTEILTEAADLISTDRAAEYGDALDTHYRIGVIWGAILGCGAIAPHDVALCMDAVKTVRAAKNPKHHDSWVDKAGYSALGGEMALT